MHPESKPLATVSLVALCNASRLALMSVIAFMNILGYSRSIHLPPGPCIRHFLTLPRRLEMLPWLFDVLRVSSPPPVP